jgi:hypothetical protein
MSKDKKDTFGDGLESAPPPPDKPKTAAPKDDRGTFATVTHDPHPAPKGPHADHADDHTDDHIDDPGFNPVIPPTDEHADCPTKDIDKLIRHLRGLEHFDLFEVVGAALNVARWARLRFGATPKSRAFEAGAAARASTDGAIADELEKIKLAAPAGAHPREFAAHVPEWLQIVLLDLVKRLIDRMQK